MCVCITEKAASSCAVEKVGILVINKDARARARCRSCAVNYWIISDENFPVDSILQSKEEE